MKIEFRNIAKKYEGRENYTLENINFEILDNEFCVILGPSGCGKSTLLRMIAGLNSITKGDLMFDGLRVNSLTPKERDIAMVFQSYALYPHMTNYQNIAYGLKVRNERKDIIDTRVKDVANILKISEYLSNKPADISGGQRQRVALGRAIARKPKLFLMDEPLSNLDAKLRESMRVELVKIHKMMGATTVYVTHDQLEAMTMANKIVVMNDSKIQQIGSPKQLYHEPANLFVANFIGTPTMSLVRGKLKGSDFVATGVKFKLSAQQLKDVKENGDQNDLWLGVRSEDVTVVKSGGNAKGKIIIAEMLGKELQINVEVGGGNSIISSLPSTASYESGDTVSLKFDPERIHLFSGKTTNRIVKSTKKSEIIYKLK